MEGHHEIEELERYCREADIEAGRGMQMLALVLFAVYGAAAGLVVVACLKWTPTYYTTIYGLQGRYLLPVLPLALVLLRTPLRRFSRAPGTGVPLMCCTAVTSVLVLFNAFLVILAR